MTKKQDKKQVTKQAKNSKADKLYHIIILALAGTLMFVGVMSLIQADPVVRYTLASTVVFFVVKELWRV